MIYFLFIIQEKLSKFKSEVDEATKKQYNKAYSNFFGR